MSTGDSNFYGFEGMLYPSEGKKFTAQEFIKLLNQEKLPFKNKSYSLQVVHEWVWTGTKVEYKSGVADLIEGEDALGMLTSSNATSSYYDGFKPYNSCPWEDIKFIQACTGWLIE